MKFLALAALFLICAAAVLADSDFRINAEDYSGALKLNILNQGSDDVANARIKAVIPELGIIFPAKSADLDEDYETGLWMLMDEEVPAGEYLVRISVRDGSQRRIRHIYVFFE